MPGLNGVIKRLSLKYLKAAMLICRRWIWQVYEHHKTLICPFHSIPNGCLQLLLLTSEPPAMQRSGLYRSFCTILTPVHVGWDMGASEHTGNKDLMYTQWVQTAFPAWDHYNKSQLTTRSEENSLKCFFLFFHSLVSSTHLFIIASYSSIYHLALLSVESVCLSLVSQHHGGCVSRPDGIAPLGCRPSGQ